MVEVLPEPPTQKLPEPESSEVKEDTVDGKNMDEDKAETVTGEQINKDQTEPNEDGEQIVVS